jgi:hypothetical protein
MATTLWLALSSASLLFGAGRPAAETLTLVADGRAQAVIVLAAAPSAAASQGAAILAAHLAQISGARLEVRRENILGGVSVQNGRIVPPRGSAWKAFVLVGESELARKLGATADGLGPGGTLLRSAGNAVVLLGPDARTAGDPWGSRHAVMAFLEELGCRYLWPGELGKVIPSRRTITVAPLEKRFTPPIGQRAIRFMPRGPRRFEEGLKFLALTPEEYEKAMTSAAATRSAVAWADWQGLGGDLGLRGGHAGAGLRGGWAEHGRQHPEWFALQADGTRDQSQAGDRWRECPSNAALIEYVANEIIERVRQEPNTPSVSLSPNDGGYSSFCLCDNCRRLDPPEAPHVNLLIFDKVGQPGRKTVEYPSLTDRYVHYWNAIAERVVKVHPRLLFVIDAYSVYATPPVREKLHPNLVVRYVPSSPSGWQGWQAAGAKRIYWRPNNLHSGFAEGILNRVQGRQIAETMRLLADGGMLATDIQGIYNNWSTAGLSYYVAARTSWNPHLGYDAILDDYCHAGFGAGAASIRRYFQGAEDLNGTPPAQIAPAAIAEMGTLLDAAARAVGEDKVVRRRIDFLRKGLEFTALSAEAYRLRDDAAANRPVDKTAAGRLLDRRWLLMRSLFRNTPLAVNVAVVAGHEGSTWQPLAWNGPGDNARKLSQSGAAAEERWLYEDQSQLR